LYPVARGLDIFDLLPNRLISKNELEAAKTVKWDSINAQGQRKFVWPPSIAKARTSISSSA
jgi:hypothetical protein